ncbi:MAG: hypothetical protein HY770_08760 [Chitinivibrionia bacterium]|nr:hypothetical protein [Chitinivibrionia bacterium]
MNENLSAGSKKIHESRTAIVSMLEKEREYGCRLLPLKQAAEDFAASIRTFLDDIGTAPLDSRAQFSAVIPYMENVYLDWKAVHGEFMETSRLAYQGMIPAENMNMDSVHAELEQTAGEPMSAVYAHLQTKWRKHIEANPWDSFIGDSAGHLDEEGLREAVQALKRGDDFDVEDATEHLTGPLRHLFSHYLHDSSAREDAVSELRDNLWKRPEIIVANDYWRQRRRSRIMDILASTPGTPSAAGFARVGEYFDWPTGTPESRARIVKILGNASPEDKEKFLRCFTMHPDQGIRRYAATNLNIGGFWKCLTPEMVPCAAILSLLERLVGSGVCDDNTKKIFFDAIYRRLHHLTSRSEVLYARGIVRIFMKLDFFLEDRYFEKLLRLLGYIEAKEAYYQIKASLLDEHIACFKNIKQKSGTVDSAPPDFGGIPPVVLRKLAKDGHFWFELCAHPRFKIARETIPYINSRDRAALVASKKNINQDVLRAVGKNKQLFSTQTARLALLANPRTPPAISLEYLPDLSRTDVELLLRKNTIHPEFRQQLAARLRGLAA